MSKIETHYHCPECNNMLDEIAGRVDALESFKFFLCRSNVNHLYRVRVDGERTSSLMRLVDKYSLNYYKDRTAKLEKKLKKAKKEREANGEV